MRRSLLLALFLGLFGCHRGVSPSTETVRPDGGAPIPVVEASPAPEAAPVDPDVQRLLDRMNEWCSSYPEECELLEHPEVHRDRVVSGESRGLLLDAEEQLRALGVEPLWDRGLQRYVLPGARDREAGR